MTIDTVTSGKPHYTQLRTLYGQLGFVPGRKRSFGASFKVFSIGMSGDAWIDTQIRYLRTTMALQFIAIALTLAGLLLLAGNTFGEITAAFFIIPAGLGFISLLRMKKGANAVLSMEGP